MKVTRNMDTNRIRNIIKNLNLLQKSKKEEVLTLLDLVLIIDHQEETRTGKARAKIFKSQKLESTIEQFINIHKRKRNILTMAMQKNLTNHKNRRSKNGQKEERIWKKDDRKLISKDRRRVGKKESLKENKDQEMMSGAGIAREKKEVENLRKEGEAGRTWVLSRWCLQETCLPHLPVPNPDQGPNPPRTSRLTTLALPSNLLWRLNSLAEVDK